MVVDGVADDEGAAGRAARHVVSVDDPVVVRAAAVVDTTHQAAAGARVLVAVTQQTHINATHQAAAGARVLVVVTQHTRILYKPCFKGCYQSLAQATSRYQQRLYICEGGSLCYHNVFV